MSDRVNPFAGPAYIMNLCNTLEPHLKPTELRNPPRTGGSQISIRLDDHVLNHVDVIVEKSGWNRAEVLYALVQRGIFDLYYFAQGETVDAIVEAVIRKGPRPQPNVPPHS